MTASRITLLCAGILLLAVTLWPSGRSGPSSKVYVVQELLWRFTSRGDPHVLDEGEPGISVRAFTSRDDAGAYVRRQEMKEREGKNPFNYRPIGAYDFLGQFTRNEEAFLALLRREGLNPPKRGKHDWHNDSLYADPWFKWWEAEAHKWDAGLRARIWDALERVRFYRIIEVGLD